MKPKKTAIKEFINSYESKKKKSKLYQHKELIFEMKKAGASLFLICKFLEEKKGIKTSISNLHGWIKRNEKGKK